MTEPQIVCDELWVELGGQSVLRNVHLEVRPGEILGILGRSGGGKTTLLRALIGLVRATQGRIVLLGEEINGMSERQLNELRRRVGMVFQYGALFDSLTVFENVAFYPRRFRRLSESQLAELVAEKLALVGLSGTENRMPGELSGGMIKRVGIARSLASDPEVMLYDEPSAGLDPIMRGAVETVIADLRRRLGVTSLIVSHDVEHVLSLADRVVLLHQGTVWFSGNRDELVSASDAVVQQFLEGSAEGPLADTLNDGQQATGNRDRGSGIGGRGSG